jgi:hypothetical protein
MCVLPPSSRRCRQYTPLESRSKSTRVHGSTCQKAVTFVLIVVRTWNFTCWKAVHIYFLHSDSKIYENCVMWHDGGPYIYIPTDFVQHPVLNIWNMATAQNFDFMPENSQILKYTLLAKFMHEERSLSCDKLFCSTVRVHCFSETKHLVL